MKSFTESVREAQQSFEDGHMLSVQSLQFSDKRVLFIKYDGEVDTTFGVQAPDSRSLFDIISNPTTSNDFSCEKTCLMGDSSNIKLAVVINHISKLLYSSNEANGLIISLSSKIFKGTTPNSNDFDKLLNVLSLVKQAIN